MAAITVQVELGPDTRELIERVVESATMELELGPKTREVLDALLQNLGERRASS